MGRWGTGAGRAGRTGWLKLPRAAAAWAAACSLAAGGLVAAGVAAATAATASPGQGAAPAATAPVCQVAYTVNSDWGTGFSAAITIANNGPAVTSWTLGYSYTGNQKLAQGWSGNWSQSGQAITVTNASWNGTLGTGASTQIGANFSYTGTNTAPTAFTLNGTACNGSGGGGGTPTVSITSPANGATFTAPASIPITASASESGGTISKVEFFNGATLLGTATSSPYTFTWSSVPAGTYSLTAEAFDASGLTATSSAVSVTVNPATTPAVVASPASLSVTQGSTGTFGVSLSTAPTSNVTVTVARTSGNTGLSVSSGGTLTFTPSNFSTAQTVTIAADSSSTGAATFSATASGYTTAAVSVTENSSSSTGTLLVNPTSFSVAQGTSDVFGVSLSSAPSGNVSVTVGRTAGNSGLAVSAGTTLTFTTSNWNYPQPVTVTADASSTGNATFTASASGYPAVSTTGTETTAGSTTTPAHVVNPFTGSSWYVNPDYTAEVATSAAGATGTLKSQMQLVGQQSTGVWLDRIAAIYGGSGNSSRMSLEAHLRAALSQESGSTPILVPIVVYDLPNRDCAALASNGELTVSNNGLQYYEQDYINPIAQILTNFEHTNIRVIAVIEPDSLPNLVTNLNDANCSQANSSGAYVNGIQYALNKLHAIPNVYNYVDIAHSAWLGWSSNMGPAVNLYKSVASGTTAGVSSMDGFISDTANYTPISEPYMTATQSINGQPVDSANFYQYNPYIDELTYDQAMYTNLVNAGFPATIGMLIDSSRNGWGGPSRPTGPSTSTDLNTFVSQSKIDERPVRGDWCNQNNAGLGPFPQANPNSSFTHLYAYVWIKPPGESDGDYPSGSHTHGDPHCDPNGTNTDGNGNTYSTGSIPGFDIPAGQWFPAEFQMLVQNASPAVP
jgi:cellulose 1,4-beta-cellobiosidase